MATYFDKGKLELDAIKFISHKVDFMMGDVLAKKKLSKASVEELKKMLLILCTKYRALEKNLGFEETSQPKEETK